MQAGRLGRGPTLLLGQPFVFHGQREMPQFRMGLQYQRPARVLSALAGDRRDLLVDPGVRLRRLEPAR